MSLKQNVVPSGSSLATGAKEGSATEIASSLPWTVESPSDAASSPSTDTS